MSQVSVLAFEAWRLVYENEKAKKVARATATKAYTCDNEAPPDHDWFRLDKEHIDREISGIAEDIIRCMMGYRTQDLELVDLLRTVQAAKNVPLDDVSTVAIVGQQAMGKSLLINALLHRRDLSKTSAAGGACTASAIKYVHKPGEGDFSEVYDAAVQFMDDVELEEITAEHARRYHHFHFSGNVDPTYKDDEEMAADTAKTFFALLWNVQNDNTASQELHSLLTSEGIQSGRLHQQALHMAHQRIVESGADNERNKRFSNMNVVQLLEKTQEFIAQHDHLPSLWPIVSHVEISMGSGLLKNAVSIVDLPGLGDLNQSRTAATNAIRRGADMEMIIAKSDRVKTEIVVDAQLKQSIRTHGAKNTILVLTKIDEFFVDNHSIDNIINTSHEHPFPTIKKLGIVNEAAQNLNETILTALKQYEGPEWAKADENTEALIAYGEYLKKTAQCAFVQQRAEKLEADMRHKYKDIDPDPIRVFSVSSSLYIDWMKKQRRREDPVLSPEMTGIPKLRRFLLGISGDQNVEAYRQHTKAILPEMLSKIQRVVDQDNKNDAFADIRPIFRQYVEGLEELQRNTFENFRKNNLIPLWSTASAKADALDSVKAVMRDWDECRWNTYNKFVRERGIWNKSQSKKYCGREVNWNKDLSEALKPSFISWRNKMRKEAREIGRTVHQHTKSLCHDITKFITGISLPTPLKVIAINEWNTCQVKVLAKSKMWKSVLGGSINQTYQYAITETDTRCMIFTINAPYFEFISEKYYGELMSLHQKDNVKAFMTPTDITSSNLIDRISSHVDNKTKKDLEYSFSVFMEEMCNELFTFDKHMYDRLPVEYELTNEDMNIRSKLKIMLPELESRVERLAAKLPQEQCVKRKLPSEIFEDFELELEAPVQKRFRQV